MKGEKTEVKKNTRFLLGVIASAGVGIAAGLGVCSLADAYVERTQSFRAIEYGTTAGVFKVIPCKGVAPYEVLPSEGTYTQLEADDPARLTITDEESQMLMKLAMAEAENQGVTGKALVMNVVHNRVLSDEFPNTIEGVIFEPVTEEYHQFSVIDDGRYDAAVPDEECQEALQMVLSYWDGSNNALYFEAYYNTNNWHRKNLTELFRYGDIIFYK